LLRERTQVSGTLSRFANSAESITSTPATDGEKPCEIEVLSLTGFPLNPRLGFTSQGCAHLLLSRTRLAFLHVEQGYAHDLQISIRANPFFLLWGCDFFLLLGDKSKIFNESAP
jgi:hypothetical protein